MRQLVYLSRATAPFDEAAIAALCKQAMERNSEDAVTGLLLYDGWRFIQALEGKADAVGRTMARIKADPRHSDIDIFSDRTVDQRLFGDWSMDYRRARAGCCSREFLDKVKVDVEAVDDVGLRAVFIGFALLGSRGPVGYRCAAG